MKKPNPLESIKLEPGWLKRQMDEVRRRYNKWSKVMRPLIHINDDLLRKHRKEAT